MELNILDEVLDELVTIRDYIRWGMSQFSAAELYYGHGTDNAWDEALMLVLHAINLPMDSNPAILDAKLTSTESQEVLDLLQQRVESRVPAAYITNQAWFMGLSFFVDERVLVPRSPIAELIETSFEPWLERDSVERVLDIGTGSGCIAIACAAAFPEADIDAADISPDALSVAKINVTNYDLENRVNLVQSDVFSGLEGQRYDLIVSNPPYVDAYEIENMPVEYQHEPQIGLASGDDGLDCTKVILAQAADHLTDQGILVVEVGASAPALMEQYPDVPFLWLEFERGGDGVFLLTAEQLREHF